MATTTTQSRLLTLAKFHPGTAGRWPERAQELFHRAITPSRAISLYALRPGYGYVVVWCNGGQDGINYYRDEQDARTYITRAARDLERQDTP